MDYPRNIPDVQSLLVAYNLPADAPDGVEAGVWTSAEAALEEARQSRSIVPAVLGVLDKIGPLASHLDVGGAQLVAGACHLIAEHGFGGKAGEALDARDSAVARLEALAGS